MKEIIGIIHFDPAIPCCGDVLGHEYTTRINDISARIIFPVLGRMPQSDDLSVEKPAIIESTRIDHWGYVAVYNAKCIDKFELIGTWIHQVVISFQCSQEEMPTSIEQLCDGINPWRAQLYERIQLLGKPILAHSNRDFFERENRATGIELYNKNDYSLIQTNGCSTFSATFTRVEECLSNDEMYTLLQVTDVSKRLKSEYSIYLNALIERNSGNTRYALMEATTACELCVTQRIRTRCEELGIDGKGLCDTYYRSLGDRFSLLKHLGIPWASADPNKEIVKPRNDLFHNRNITPTLSECSAVLDAVRNYLNAYILEMYE